MKFSMLEKCRVELPVSLVLLAKLSRSLTMLVNGLITELIVLVTSPILPVNARMFLAPTSVFAKLPIYRTVPLTLLFNVAIVLATHGPMAPMTPVVLLMTAVLRPLNVFLNARASLVVPTVLLPTFSRTSVLPNLREATLFPVTVLWKPFAHVLPPSTVLRSPLEVLGTVLVSRP